MITLKYKSEAFNESIDSVEITLKKDPSRDELLDAFASFMKAIGYPFDGMLEIVDNDNSIKESFLSPAMKERLKDLVEKYIPVEEEIEEENKECELSLSGLEKQPWLGGTYKDLQDQLNADKQ